MVYDLVVYRIWRLGGGPMRACRTDCCSRSFLSYPSWVHGVFRVAVPFRP
jgi:hypothetical protein